MRVTVRISIVAVLLAGATAWAAPIASESFDYGDGSSTGLSGKGSAGEGWAGAWGSGTAAVLDSGTALSYAVPGGGTVDGGDRTSRLASTLGLGGIGRSFDTSCSGDVYVSYLIRWSEGNLQNGTFLTLWLGNSGGPQVGIRTHDGETRDFFVRMAGSGDETYSLTDEFGTGYDGGWQSPNMQTHLVVGHLYKDGSGNYNRFDLWVNPAYGDEASPEATNTAASSISSLSTIGLRATNMYGSTRIDVDELRFGTTWADVVPGAQPTEPIPEPASALLLAVGLGAVLRRRRRP